MAVSNEAAQAKIEQLQIQESSQKSPFETYSTAWRPAIAHPNSCACSVRGRGTPPGASSGSDWLRPSRSWTSRASPQKLWPKRESICWPHADFEAARIEEKIRRLVSGPATPGVKSDVLTWPRRMSCCEPAPFHANSLLIAYTRRSTFTPMD